MAKLVVIGSGPAAFAAAMYAARESTEVVVYEKETMGGIASSIDTIENYPGFPDGITGMALMNRMREQAEKYGAVVEYGEVTKLECKKGSCKLIVDDEEVEADAVLIATGCKRRPLGIPGEAEFVGRGVHYCATCDGAVYSGKRLLVVGGANSALQEAIYLTRFADKVELVVRNKMKASKILQDAVQKLVKVGKMKVHTGAVPLEVVGDGGRFSGLRVEEAKGKRLVKADGMFVFVGMMPVTDFLDGVELADDGSVKTDANYMTNLKGVFVAGDVRSGATKQIVCACGEGAAAAMKIRDYLEGF